jgi:FtsZ-interacting cell division protein ZipA
LGKHLTLITGAEKMTEETIVSIIFAAGILVIILVGIGVWNLRREMQQHFEEEREKKLSYRTNEEFIGRTG